MNKIVFIGGGFFGEIESYVLANSTGVIQNAANVFQENLLEGMHQIYNEKLVILNFPFVGSYPKRFKKLWFKSFRVNGISSYSFFNLSGFKLISRFLVTCKALLDVKPNSESCIVIYSIHLPFLLAATLYKKFICKNIKIVLIVPDLPEYMTPDNSSIVVFLKRIQNQILKSCYKEVDGYTFLTEYMHEKIPAVVNDYIIVEGVSKPGTLDAELLLDLPNSIFYSGTLDARYGIKDLVKAVEKMAVEVQLIICGEGDTKGFILDAARRTSRIKYLGQLPREQILKIQKSATLLVNPRTDTELFTKYSFPSKIMEYMCSGRPVLMYPLSGIPNEYYDYCFCIRDGGVEALRDSLDSVMQMDPSLLDEVGLRAKNFVLNEKTGLKQSQKIYNLIERLR